MKSIDNFKSLAMVTGAALVLSATSGAVLAEANPFGMADLNQGYQVAMKEGKCGEGSKPKAAEAKCGEGKCGGSKPKAAEAKCGGSKPKAAEAKCGEGKCGGNK